MLYWILKRVVLGPILLLLFRPKVTGRKNLPKQGAAILASNHMSFSDSIFLPLAVPRRITFLAKSEYFTGRGLKGWIVKKFFQGVGQVPIDRSGGRSSEAAVNAAINILKSGEILGIYPEGTRSPDGKLYRGRTGLARIAIEAGVPVIPVAMIGTYDIQPTGQVFPKIMRVGIAFGEPIDMSQYAGRQRDPAALREATNLVMDSLKNLGGQEYVDIYATKAKEILANPQADATDAENAADAEEN
ncbi:MAG: lysophospholipid acyltransferase family protein [Actinobacteria bacterium]|jgi:1-acyl-sn-glycerol-3-phosphate acyltransferase|nr:lysophospholipid acyltransferase family protein [Actinomycetota bacterium]